MNRGELDAPHGRFFRAGQLSAIDKRQGGRFALGQRLRQAQPDGHVLRNPRCGHLPAGFVGHAIQGQGVVQLESKAGGVVQGGEADLGRGLNGLGVRIHLGIDGVVVHVDAWTLRLLALAEPLGLSLNHQRRRQRNRTQKLNWHEPFLHLGPQSNNVRRSRFPPSPPRFPSDPARSPASLRLPLNPLASSASRPRPLTTSKPRMLSDRRVIWSWINSGTTWRPATRFTMVKKGVRTRHRCKYQLNAFTR